MDGLKYKNVVTCSNKWLMENEIRELINKK